MEFVLQRSGRRFLLVKLDQFVVGEELRRLLLGLRDERNRQTREPDEHESRERPRRRCWRMSKLSDHKPGSPLNNCRYRLSRTLAHDGSTVKYVRVHLRVHGPKRLRYSAD